jgi:UDP-N-acetylmuramate dehydrogenase
MSHSWQDALRDYGNLRLDEPLGRHTTFGIGGAAQFYFTPSNKQGLIDALRTIPRDLPVLPLGRGSNLLVSDDGYAGLVIDMGGLDELRQEGELIAAEAGVRMGRLARTAADAGLAGVEFMATVPGDVGGGVVMNAGAFGQQISDTLGWVEIVHRNGEVETIPQEKLEMSYRHTRLPKGSLVLCASFTLAADNPVSIKARMRKMRNRRRSSQPLESPNCGSVFKNPPGDFAARLIEEAGLKGCKVGGARISLKHANFIINEGQATSHDVISLIERAQCEVKKRFGVLLEPEVHVTGGMS